MSIRGVKKSRGRPATGKGEPVTVRLQPTLVGPLDAWIMGQPDNPSRPEAIRRLLDTALAVGAAGRPFDASAFAEALPVEARSQAEIAKLFDDYVAQLSYGKNPLGRAAILMIAGRLEAMGYPQDLNFLDKT